jgi:hypothetical protein
LVLDNYVDPLKGGATFPPVTVFRENETLWLADGFHRWHAHQALKRDEIDIERTDGSFRDALLYSLSCNGKHGLQRNRADCRRAYEIACRNELVNPADRKAVAALLGCSGRWASDLTEPSRAAAKAARDAEIIRLKESGKSNREIASVTGTPHSTVDRVVAAPERNSSVLGQDPVEMGTRLTTVHDVDDRNQKTSDSDQPQAGAEAVMSKEEYRDEHQKLQELSGDPDDDEETLVARLDQVLADIDALKRKAPMDWIIRRAENKRHTSASEASAERATGFDNWSGAMDALISINKQVSVEKLFAERFTGFDEAFAPELEKAFEWITALHERFKSPTKIGGDDVAAQVGHG